MGLLDNFLTLTGHSDPRMQIAAALNPVAAQLGGGPAPGPPPSPGGPPGGGAPGQPPATGAPQAAPGGPAPAPPQPQAYQSPPALSQAYSQLANPPNLVDLMAQAYQRQQTSSDFDKHLGMIIAGFGRPRSRGVAEALMGSQGQDPGPMFSNLLQLQGYSQEQQRYADLINNGPAYAKSFGIDPDMFMATIKAAGPAGAGQVLGKIAEAQMGITGTQTDKEYRQQVRNFQAANPGAPLPPELQSEAAWAVQQGEAVTTANAKAKDLVADKANFAPALQAYDESLGIINQLNTPAMKEGMKEFLGTGGAIRPVATMSPAGKAAWALYSQLMAKQFSAGVQDFKGAGRITQQELNQDLPSQSTMSKLNQDPESFFAGMNTYQQKLQASRANLFGKAQYLSDPRLNDADFDKYVSQNYKPGGDLGPKSTNRAAPDTTVKTPADAAKLPHGRAFVIPDGSGAIGYAP